LGLRFAVGGEAHLVDSRRDARAGDASRPHDQAGKGGGVGVAEVPHEAVHARRCGDARGRAAAERILFSFFGGRRLGLDGRLAGELLDQLALGVQKLQRHFALGLVLQPGLAARG